MVSIASSIYQRNVTEKIMRELRHQVTLSLNDTAFTVEGYVNNTVLKNLREAAKTFKQREKVIWDELGKGGTNLTDFTNRTGEMKRYTGYKLFFDGVNVSARNKMLDIEKPTGALYRNPNGRGRMKDMYAPLTGGHKGTPSYSTKMRYVSLYLYADSEHAFFVDNPSHTKRGRKGRKLSQGTGWFRLYCRLVMNAFYLCFKNSYSLGSLLSIAGGSNFNPREIYDKVNEYREYSIGIPRFTKYDKELAHWSNHNKDLKYNSIFSERNGKGRKTYTLTITLPVSVENIL